MFRQPFIEGWDFITVLGEGTFGQVKLALNNETKETVAVKIIDINENTDKNAIRKEILVHSSLSHERIVRYFGCRKESHQWYLFMEYVSNGELYNLIDPGQPLDRLTAFRFFSQLLEGLEHMHKRGIVHRDIKLENLLVDCNNNLKITDFGFSTLFKDKKSERYLDRVCGSIPYLAPEVLSRRLHKAEPIDMWSSGIVLYIFFQGEFPWDRADYSCAEYVKYAGNQSPGEAWNKLSREQLEIIRSILCVDPLLRSTIQDARNSNWFKKISNECKPLKKANETNRRKSASKNGYSLSQQCEDSHSFLRNVEFASVAPNAHKTDDAFFSQPINVEEDVLVSQCSPCFGDATQLAEMSKFFKRLTRFIVSDIEFVPLITHLCTILEFFRCCWQMPTPKSISVKANDRRNLEIKFKILIFCSPNKKILVDFKLAQGDGLEFKRLFKNIREKITQIVPHIQ